MSEMLLQAIAQLDLQPGQCENLHVNGRHIEIRCVEDEEKSQFADMVMLEPWVELSDGKSGVPVRVRYAPHPLPVPPDIPSDEEETA